MVKRSIACDKCTKVCETFHRKQKGPSPIIARFFKIIVPKAISGTDESKLLYLPPKFVRKANLASPQETEIEDSSGSRWSVTLSNVNGLLAFKDGWRKFYQDHGLAEGQLLVFNYIKGSHFVVQIYQRNACETLNFNKVRTRSNKKRRRDSESVSRDEPFQTPDINSRKKRHTSTPVTPQSELQDPQTCLAMEKADLERQRNPPTLVSMDDPSWMINRDDSYYRGEDRNFLYDLSSFEMEKQTPDANKIETAFDTVIAPSHTEFMEDANKFEIALDTNTAPHHIGLPEQTKTSEDDTQMAAMDTNLTDGDSGGVPASKSEKAIDTEMPPSHANITKLSKTNEDNTKTDVNQKNQTYGNSCDIFADKFDKVSTKIAPSSHTEIMEGTETMEDDNKKPVILRNQITDHSGDIVPDKFHTKPSDNSILSKGMSNDVSYLQNSKKSLTGKNHVMASDSRSPFVGSNKIAEGESAVKHRSFGSLISSSVPGGPYGYRAIKKELADSGEGANAFPGVSYDAGKEPAVVMNYNQMCPPVVKLEPDLSHEVVSSVEVSPFSAEVKNQSYLELDMPSIPRRRDRGPKKVVFLKDPNGKLWPLLYLDGYSVKALTANWTIFCQQNNIKPGEECRFHVEKERENNKDYRYIYKVDVARRSGRPSGN